MAPAPKRARNPNSAQPARGLGRFGCSRDSSRFSKPVPACKGVGTIISDPCDTCHGRGRIRKTRTLSVKVPAGVDDGDRIRLSGEGEAGRNGGPPGDLFVEIRLNPHKIVYARGLRSRCARCRSAFAAATLGGEVELPTLDGHVSLKVPVRNPVRQGVPPAWQGVVPTVRDPRTGDLFAKVSVETPVNLTSEQKESVGQV